MTLITQHVFKKIIECKLAVPREVSYWAGNVETMLLKCHMNQFNVEPTLIQCFTRAGVVIVRMVICRIGIISSINKYFVVRITSKLQ